MTRTSASPRSSDPATSSALLHVRDLVVEFTDRGAGHEPAGARNPAARSVDREVLGIVGETGCGKSITGPRHPRHAAGAGSERTGHVEFAGVEQLSLSESKRALNRGDAISIVFQNPGTAFNPVFTDWESRCSMVLRRHRRLPRTRGRCRDRAAADRRRPHRHADRVTECLPA